MPNINERPILFSAAMVRAILAGTKVQTRREVKLRNGQYIPPSERADPNGWRQMLRLCPYGHAGDRLWVRETFADAGCRLTYRADQDDGAHCVVKKWIPSIHMPRAASRIPLEIVSVRVERLRDISEADAVAEGCVAEPCDHSRQSCEDIGCYGPTAAGVFHWLWDQLNGPDSWDANPWVWVIEFRRVDTAA